MCVCPSVPSISQKPYLLRACPLQDVCVVVWGCALWNIKLMCQSEVSFLGENITFQSVQLCPTPLSQFLQSCARPGLRLLTRVAWQPESHCDAIVVPLFSFLMQFINRTRAWVMNRCAIQTEHGHGHVLVIIIIITLECHVNNKMLCNDKINAIK